MLSGGRANFGDASACSNAGLFYWYGAPYINSWDLLPGDAVYNVKDDININGHAMLVSPRSGKDYQLYEFDYSNARVLPNGKYNDGVEKDFQLLVYDQHSGTYPNNGARLINYRFQ